MAQFSGYASLIGQASGTYQDAYSLASGNIAERQQRIALANHFAGLGGGADEDPKDFAAKMSISDNKVEAIAGNLLLGVSVTNEALTPLVGGAVLEAAAIKVGKAVVDRYGVPLVMKQIDKIVFLNPKFTQITASSKFSSEPGAKFAGRTIGEVSDALRSGAIKAEEVPVEVVFKNGSMLVVNTRSSLALTRAGVPVERWKIKDLTGNPAMEKKVAERLRENGLGQEGVDTIRITGNGRNMSNLE